MTRTGIRAWIGRNPEMTVVTVSMAALVLPFCMGMALLLFSLLSSVHSGLEEYLWFAPLATFPLAIAGISFYVVCVRHRAGLSCPRFMPLRTAYMCTAISTFLSPVVCVIAWPGSSLGLIGALCVLPMIIGLTVALVSAPSVCLARWYACRQTARGKWETTVPIQHPGEDP